MHQFRRHLRTCTWLALLAMATLAFGPTVSRFTLPEAGRAATPSASQVATVDHAAMHHAVSHHAMHLASGDAAGPRAPTHHQDPAAAPQGHGLPTLPPHHHSLEHCALCVVAAGAFAMAPPPPAVASRATAVHRVASLPRIGVAPVPAVWSPAQPRGPPAIA